MIITPPLRLKILMAVTDLIKTVSPTNGSQMDLSDVIEGGVVAEKRVIRGRRYIGHDDPEFLVSLIEPPTTVEPTRSKAPDNPTRYNEWDILVQGWAKNDKDNEECDLAYVLAAEVQKALGTELVKKQSGRPGATNFLGLGNTITSIKIGTPVVRPTEEVTDYGVFYLILTLQFVEDTAKPFG